MPSAAQSPPRPVVRLLPQLADFAARHYGDAPFLMRWATVGREPWTFSEAARRLHASTALLEREGVKAGDRVAIQSENRPEWGLAYLAALEAGAVVVPLDALLKEHEVGEIILQSEARFCVVSARQRPVVERARDSRLPSLRLLSLDPCDDLPSWPVAQERFPDDGPRPERASPDDLAVLLFASGTAGQAKAVMLSHPNLLHNVEALMRAIPYVVLRRLCLARGTLRPSGMSASPARFKPPCCPNPGRPFHCCAEGWRFKRIGFFTRLAAPNRIQRCQCSHCRRTFSTQTFSPTYWLRHPELLQPLFFRLLACSGFRQLAREFAVSHTTILGQSARLGRHCLLFQHCHRPRAAPAEPLVLDGFESFEFSQYHPCHFHVVVGQESHFFYSFTDLELRRKGRMTARQRDRRRWFEQHFGQPDSRSIEVEVAQALQLVVPPGSLTELHSDGHPACPRALNRLAEHRFRHRVTPGSAPRTTANALFPVNLLDLLIRHGSANHKRETIAFSKRRQSAIERLAVLQVWRNFIKPFSERRRSSFTPAECLWLCERRLAVAEVLKRRLLPSQVRLPERLERYYRREVPTRRIPRGVRHRLRCAD